MPASTILKVLAFPVFFIQAAGDERARISHDEASRFHDDMQAQRLEGGNDGLGVSAQRELGAVFIPPFLDAGIQRILVNDADAAADGEEF